MKLIPKEIEATLPPLYSQENVADPVAVIKLFHPCGRYTLYVLEGSREPDGDLLFFGFCVSPLGPDGDKFGWTSLRELQDFRGPLGLGIERDLYFQPTPITRLMTEIGERASSVSPAPRYPKLIPAPMYDDSPPDYANS